MASIGGAAGAETTSGISQIFESFGASLRGFVGAPEAAGAQVAGDVGYGAPFSCGDAGGAAGGGASGGAGGDAGGDVDGAASAAVEEKSSGASPARTPDISPQMSPQMSPRVPAPASPAGVASPGQQAGLSYV